MASTLTGPAHDRRGGVDALLGAALFGVVLMNVTSFVIVPRIPEILENETIAGFMTSYLALATVGGKARSIFALLFGVGFAILLSRAGASGADFTAFYRRRLGLLLVIGVLNMLFLFWGDILILYALLGFVLIGFRNASDRMVLQLGLALCLVPSLVKGAVLLALGDMTPQMSPAPAMNTDALMGGDLFAYMQTNAAGYFGRYVSDPAGMVIYVLHVLGMFLLGLWCVRKGMVEDISAHRPFLWKVFLTGLIPGLGLSALYFLSYTMGESLSGPFKALVYASYIGVPILAVAYASGLMLVFSGTGSVAKVLRGVFAPAGRMALTGYLGASACAGFILYGWGLGTLQSWSMLTSHGLGLAIFAGLAAFSAVWLRIFRFGPAEWLWRSATYGRIQPLLSGPAKREPTP